MSDYKPNTNYFIEASAGTGKTYNIIEYLKDILPTVENDISKFLVVTYTDKAVEELKNRVRNKIKGIDYNKSEIYTIHSFCQKIISEYCVSLKKPINLNVIDEGIVSDFVDSYIRDTNIFNEISKIKRRYKDFDITKLRNIIVSLIKKYYLDKNGKIDETIISINYNVDRRAEELIWLDSYGELKIKDPDLFNDIEAINTLSPTPEAREVYDKIKEIIDSKPIAFSRNIGTCPKNKKNSYATEVHKKFSAIPKIDNKDIYNYLATRYINEIYEKWIKTKTSFEEQSFSDMIRFVREEILDPNGVLKKKIQEKYRYAVIDEFQDTNQLQWDIFSNIFLSDINNLVVVGDPKQSIYSFQGADVFVYNKAIKKMIDLNATQKKLVDNYRASENMIKATNELFKTNNFISDFAVFTDSKYPEYKHSKEEKNAKIDDKDFKSIWIAYKGSDSDEILELGNYDFAKIAVNKIIECTEYANGKTRLQISNGEGGYRDVTFKDFTVLSRTRPEASAIKEELQKVGIPYVSYKDNTLFKGCECANWIALLQAIDAIDFTGVRNNIFRRALFTDFFDKTLEEISDEKYDLDGSSEMKMILHFKDIAKTRRYDDLIDSIIIESGLESRLSSLDKIQSLSAYEQIGDFAVDYLTNNHTIIDLIRKLDALRKKEDDGEDLDDDVDLIGRSTDFNCVQIMTIHASKGLEFPVVIFAGNLNNISTRGEGAFLSHDDNNNPQIEFEKSGKYDLEHAQELRRLYYVAFTRARYLLIIPNYNRVGKSTKKVINKYAFLDSILREFMKKGEYCDLIDYNNFIKSYNLDNEKIIVHDILDKQKGSLNIGNIDEQKAVISKLIGTSSNKSIYQHSYSSLSHSKIKEELDGVDEEMNIEEYDKEGEEILNSLKDFDKNGIVICGLLDDKTEPVILSDDYPKGAVIGTALHEVFELLPFNKYSDELLKKIIAESFNKQGIKDKKEWVEETNKLVNEVMNAKLPEIHGNKDTSTCFSLNEISEDNKKAEVEFNFSFIKEHLNKKAKGLNYATGFVDLIFRRGDYYSILDWKSDKLNDEDLFNYFDSNSLINHTNNHYSIQRVLYSYTLIKWLKKYYPEKGEDEIFNDHFGGVYYVYIRGCNDGTANGIFAKTWNSFSELEESYIEIMQNRIGG